MIVKHHDGRGRYHPTKLPLVRQRRPMGLGGGPLCAGMYLTGAALTAGSAQATPPYPGRCSASDGGPPCTWCPGDPPVSTGNHVTNPVVWDESVCHQYWYTPQSG